MTRCHSTSLLDNVPSEAVEELKAPKSKGTANSVKPPPHSPPDYKALGPYGAAAQAMDAMREKERSRFDNFSQIVLIAMLSTSSLIFSLLFRFLEPTMFIDWRRELEMTCRLSVAGAVGAVIGIERRFSSKRPAGIRTTTLVSVGAAVFTLASLSFASVGGDPARIAAQVASGVGFIGAGIIDGSWNVEPGGKIALRGITTAAGIWVAAALGVAAGRGLYALAIWGALLTLGVLEYQRLSIPLYRGLNWFTRKLRPPSEGSFPIPFFSLSEIFDDEL
ncbi:unnamed protein product [Vitrella brassicaformis CCMP3155]|uniref:MgtC/SapB/SrpB/YhiD N-terminal domain-containing protein n=1 Tax=Vitrella brassicaformis (strain CCMP3155) TaxID=1169540 RepID=A0A0G4GQH9_VITBC|nr:unnamed protein product [Vitrella brassicaformis CCMP3155]|eukprot:CEM32720.1 unnamed protein product [Vitrella brassicaformis CCMP3155]